MHHAYGICYQTTLPQEQTGTLEKATTNIQDASISNNRKIKICHIKKTHPSKGPECLKKKKPRLTQSPFLRDIAMIPNTCTKFEREDLLWIAAFNNMFQCGLGGTQGNIQRLHLSNLFAI